MAMIVFIHEVENGERWAKAWHPGPGSRHELLAKYGVAARTFRDPQNPNMTGLIMEVSDMKQVDALMQSDEAWQAMSEDGLKMETLRLVREFTP